MELLASSLLQADFCSSQMVCGVSFIGEEKLIVTSLSYLHEIIWDTISSHKAPQLHS